MSKVYKEFIEKLQVVSEEQASELGAKLSELWLIKYDNKIEDDTDFVTKHRQALKEKGLEVKPIETAAEAFDELKS